MRQRQGEDVRQDLSVFIKQVGLLYFPKEKVAALYGESLIKFLDSNMQGEPFSKGVGRLLTVLPYEKQIRLVPDELFDLLKQWLRRVK